MVERMSLGPEDMLAERMGRLREFFPEVFTEGKSHTRQAKRPSGCQGVQPHTSARVNGRHWQLLYAGAEDYVVGLLEQGRISSGKAAELLDTTVHRVHELARERGVEIGASVEEAEHRARRGLHPQIQARKALDVRQGQLRVVAKPHLGDFVMGYAARRLTVIHRNYV